MSATPSDALKLLRQATTSGQRWSIHDGEIAEPAKHLYGWEGMVYKFSSGFIHLSYQHDYMTRDPFLSLDPSVRKDLVDYINGNHHANLAPDCTFAEIVDYVPKVFDKISKNLERFLGKLERGEVPGTIERTA